MTHSEQLISHPEQLIIDDAVYNALTWGLGLLTAAQEAIEDAGYTWTAEHEKYVFKTHVEGGPV